VRSCRDRPRLGRYGSSVIPVNKGVRILRLLSLDPGTANFGWAVVEVRHNKGQVAARVLENGKCEHTVHTLKNAKEMREEMLQFELWLGLIMGQYEPQAATAERFMTRGINGPTVECVNIMIGQVLTLVDLPFKIMPAATWKNAISRSGVDLKEQYKLTKVTPHQVDAAMIGIYTGCQAYGFKDFGPLDLEYLFPRLLRQLEDTSTAKLINRKIK
jgi:Holliday junction resolvasome RuvABC endonuclease subunit